MWRRHVPSEKPECATRKHQAVFFPFTDQTTQPLSVNFEGNATYQRLYSSFTIKQVYPVALLFSKELPITI